MVVLLVKKKKKKKKRKLVKVRLLFGLALLEEMKLAVLLVKVNRYLVWFYLYK